MSTSENPPRMIHTAELVSTGAELLSGRSVNTHARLLGERLGRIGVRLMRDTTVPDDIDVIQTVVREAASRADMVFISGGLGPTSDDVTREAVAGVLGCGIVLDAAALAQMRARLDRAGRALTPARERQALVLTDATVFLNPAGAAPGMGISRDGTLYIMLPGPPPEFEAVLDTHVLSWLCGKLDCGAALRERVLLVHGIGESDVVQRFEQSGFPPAGVEMAYCASAGRVEVRLLPYTTTTDHDLERASAQAAGLLAPHVYASERITPEVLIGRLLGERGQTLATAESCTGGLIAERITTVSGSTAYFRGGVIAYANAVKQNLLGVSPAALDAAGAVSEPVAGQMAVGARQVFGVDYSIAVTGIAGPTGATADKPVGLVYTAIAHPDGVTVYRDVYPGNRVTVRESTCVGALIRLARLIQQAPES